MATLITTPLSSCFDCGKPVLQEGEFVLCDCCHELELEASAMLERFNYERDLGDEVGQRVVREYPNLNLQQQVELARELRQMADFHADQADMWFMLPADVAWLHTASPAD